MQGLAAATPLGRGGGQVCEIDIVAGLGTPAAFDMLPARVLCNARRCATPLYPQPRKTAWAMSKDCTVAWPGAVDTAVEECRGMKADCVMFDTNREKCGKSFC